jgi:hypothetical protein
MLLDAVWDLVRREVFSRAPTEGLFNPYRDRVDGFDLPAAVEIRQDNFHRYLSSYRAMPRLFLLAEAPGPWGCRFSGVPLVSEAQLVDPEFPLDGRPSSVNEAPYAEYTAGIYWRVLGPWFPHFFTWNSVPYHPYKPDRLLSIRNPGQREVLQFVEIARAMVDIMQPECVLAIGRKAEYALGRAGVPCTYIRHPSQGGARKFEEGIEEVVRELKLPPRSG